MKYLTQTGLSLIEVLVSITFLSGILYLVMQQTSNVASIQNRAGVNAEITELTDSITRTLSDHSTCTELVVGTLPGTIVNNVAADGIITKDLVRNMRNTKFGVDPSAPPFIRVTILPPQQVLKTLEFKRMQLVHEGNRDFIRVTFDYRERLKNLTVGGNSSVIKDFVIKGNRDEATGKFTECVSATLASELGKCHSLLGRKWNTVKQKCEFPDHVKRERTLSKVYKTADGKLMVENLELANDLSCACAATSCEDSPDCTCDPGSCPSPLKTGAVDTFTVVDPLGDKCEMRVSCYQILPIPAGALELGFILDH